MHKILVLLYIGIFLTSPACQQGAIGARSNTAKSYGSSESLLSYVAQYLKKQGFAPDLSAEILSKISLEGSGDDALATMVASLDAALNVVVNAKGIDAASAVGVVFNCISSYFFQEPRSRAEGAEAMRLFNDVLVAHTRGLDKTTIAKIFETTIKENANLSKAAGAVLSYGELSALTARSIVSQTKAKVLAPSQASTEASALGGALAALNKSYGDSTAEALASAKLVVAAILDEAKPITTSNLEAMGGLVKGFTTAYTAAVSKDLSTSAATTFKSDLQTYFDTLVDASVADGSLTSSAAEELKDKVTLIPRTSYSLSIDAGADYTALTTVDLTLAATDATEMYVTNTSGCAAGGTWETYATSKLGWTLGQTNATATVYVKFRDASNKESTCISASIVQDSAVPLTPSLDISSQIYSGSLTVVASQNATVDAHFKEFRYRLDNTVPTSCSDGTASSGSITITGTSDITMKVIACDYAGNKSAAAVTGTYTYNHPPVASGGSQTLAEDAGATSLTLPYTDADADDATSCGIVASPAHGTMSACSCTAGTCSVSFTPTANYNGSDTFTYRVNDGHAFSSAATFTLTITAVNDAPVASGGSLTMNEDAGATTLTLAYTDVDTGDQAVSCATVAGVSHGVLGACSCTSGVCTRTYTPTANYSGADSFTYKVNDGDTDSNTATFNLTVTAVNDAPVVATNTGDSLSVGDTVTITTAKLNATDADDADTALTFTVTTLATHGSLKKSGTTLTVNQTFTQDDIANNLITYVHTGGDDTDDSFRFTLKDAANSYATAATVASPATFSISVAAAASGSDDIIISVSSRSGPTSGGSGGDACMIHSSVTYCWGGGALTPTAVSMTALTGGETTFKSISVGGSTNSMLRCALTPLGKAYCWGSDASGQLGNGAVSGTKTDPYPVDMSGLSGGETTFKSITVGGTFACALTPLGKAYCWGDNGGGSGYLGDGTSSDRLVPTAVDTSTLTGGESTFIKIDAASEHTCAITALGKAYCWGRDLYGELGNGVPITDKVSPSPVDTTTLTGGETTFKAIDSGTNSTCAITTNNKAYCWGRDITGQLGNGDADGSDHESPSAVDMSLLTGGETAFSSISVGNQGACALTPLGKAYCWGSNNKGELGAGSFSSSINLPNPVDTSGIAGAKTFSALATGYVGGATSAGGFSCAVTTDNVPYCWGWELDGAADAGTLGNGATSGDKNLPSAVTLPSCGGTTFGGYCWYYGTAGESCTLTCAAHGGYNAATKTYAGSDGDENDCFDLLNTIASPVPDNTTSNSCAAFSMGLGCHTYPSATLVGAHCTAYATTEAADDPGTRRACACNN